MKLTNIQIKNARPKDKMYRLSDGENFYLEVHPNGSKYWRLGYTHEALIILRCDDRMCPVRQNAIQMLAKAVYIK